MVVQLFRKTFLPHGYLSSGFCTGQVDYAYPCDEAVRLTLRLRRVGTHIPSVPHDRLGIVVLDLRDSWENAASPTISQAKITCWERSKASPPARDNISGISKFKRRKIEKQNASTKESPSFPSNKLRLAGQLTTGASHITKNMPKADSILMSSVTGASRFEL
jgi:hypothetical protein